jgi:hypothetical protein
MLSAIEIVNSEDIQVRQLLNKDNEPFIIEIRNFGNSLYLTQEQTRYLSEVLETL